MRLRSILALTLFFTPYLAVAQAAEPTLEERLQRLEDKDAIREIIQDYAVKLTSRDFDGYVALFAPEGVWRNGDIVKRGRDEIKAMLQDMFPDTPSDYVNEESYMLVSNIQIEIDGDRATAHSRQLSIIRGLGGDPTPVLAGRYEDVFVRRDGAWKILDRNDVTFIPSPEEWAKKMQEGILTLEE